LRGDFGGTAELDCCVADMLWAQRFAAAHRAKMMTAAMASLTEVTNGAAVETERINCHHNFAARKYQRGREGWVSRRGRSAPGRTTVG
jgi:tRNA-splicing ligase RtcB